MLYYFGHSSIRSVDYFNNKKHRKSNVISRLSGDLILKIPSRSIRSFFLQIVVYSLSSYIILKEDMRELFDVI